VNSSTVSLHSANQLFGFELGALQLPVLQGLSEIEQALVPQVIDNYQFDLDLTMALLASFTHNRRLLVQGLHGSGKSSHIEQVAARLNWPCLRVNLDGQITRMDLIGRDAIVLRDGKQVTEFQPGVLPWAVERPIALVFDEYDAGRPDVMFVIQRMLEREGKLTLLDQNKVQTPHKHFRLFATANTLGMGDMTGMYRGVQSLNHAQLDRWNMVARLDYLPAEHELRIVLAQVPGIRAFCSLEELQAMVALAGLTRKGYAVGEIASLMSLRSLITWAENAEVFKDFDKAFRYSVLNRYETGEQELIGEYFQRCFGRELRHAAGT
jgi:cobaltochelatase CobS